MRCIKIPSKLSISANKNLPRIPKNWKELLPTIISQLFFAIGQLTLLWKYNNSVLPLFKFMTIDKVRSIDKNT